MLVSYGCNGNPMPMLMNNHRGAVKMRKRAALAFVVEKSAPEVVRLA